MCLLSFLTKVCCYSGLLWLWEMLSVLIHSKRKVHKYFLGYSMLWKECLSFLLNERQRTYTVTISIQMYHILQLGLRLGVCFSVTLQWWVLAQQLKHQPTATTSAKASNSFPHNWLKWTWNWVICLSLTGPSTCLSPGDGLKTFLSLSPIWYITIKSRFNLAVT